MISQDTSAYGVDIRYRDAEWRGQKYETRFLDLARGLGELGIWIRMHYVYPYPHVDNVIPLMAERKVLPYLDIPFQHGSPTVLKRMRRPGQVEKTLERIRAWREICPDLTIRSTFIVGFPGETEAEFEELLAWLDEAQLDRVGAFKYSPVEGAAANDVAPHVAPEIQEERLARFMQKSAHISAAKLAAKVGRRHARAGRCHRRQYRHCAQRRRRAGDRRHGAHRPDRNRGKLPVGEFADVEITGSGDHDLEAKLVA